MQINAAPLWGFNYLQDKSEATEILMIPEQNNNSAVRSSKVVVVVFYTLDLPDFVHDSAACRGQKAEVFD